MKQSWNCLNLTGLCAPRSDEPVVEDGNWWPGNRGCLVCQEHTCGSGCVHFGDAFGADEKIRGRHSSGYWLTQYSLEKWLANGGCQKTTDSRQQRSEKSLEKLKKLPEKVRRA